MLPAFITTPKNLIATSLLASVIATSATAPAMAWGKGEQNFVAGVASTLLLEAIVNPQMFHSKKPPVYVQPLPAPVYYTQPSYAPTNIYQSPSGVAFNSYASNERTHIQSRLAALGYYHGSIDGSFGPNTFNAVSAYATNTGKTGLLSTQSGAFTLYDGLLF